ncbi:MAG TPA: pyridoxal-phosphate dependent enzyme [Polyangia bacterium]|nr:pyridoxal-phosphate dependent enzyme [Polyangia bacterium]
MHTSNEALLAALLGDASPFERVRLGLFPTPLTEVALPLPGARFWVKRDDLSSPHYGGNKVRKLEFLLARGRGRVVTIGACGSHHVLACAIHARRLGRGCVGLLVSRPMTAHAAAVQDLLERHLDHVVRLDRIPRQPRSLGRILGALGGPDGIRGALFIPPGASSPAGTLGYVACGLELAGQIAAGSCPGPARIYTALGTGGTAAGLALGLALAGSRTEVVAVRVASAVAGNRWFLGLLARRAFALLARRGLAAAWPGLRLRVDHRFAGPGYGHETKAARRAVAAAAAAGLDLETTYTGKALAALLEDRLAAGTRRREAVMFLDTCGSLAALHGAPDRAASPLEDRCTTTR